MSWQIYSFWNLRIYEYGSINYDNGSIMGYEILGSDFSDFVSPYYDVETSSNEESVKRIKIASQKGEIHYKEHVLHKQLSIQEGHYYMQDDVKISGKGDSALLEIQFNLSDKAISYQDKSKNEHITSARSGNIVFLSAEENQARILFQKDISYSTFDIHLPLSLLDHYAGESKLLDSFLTQIHKDRSSSLFTKNGIGITPSIYNAIQDIKMCTYEGLTKKIYLESKAYEIIALLYENSKNNKDSNELSTFDQERIHWAAAIIRDNLAQPFTIVELAHQVGINQTKLKTGFKSILGNTVFGYLQDIRMHQAKKYLLDTQLTIQEISLLLGYQNTSNFSIAFKRIHGYPPLKMREKKTIFK